MVQDVPPLRADAQRNRDRILNTAAQHFAARGIDASLEDIAKGAGVGSGTLYRHFPTRDALLAATLRKSQEQLLAAAEAARVLHHPAAALQAWLKALQTYLRTFNGLPAPVLAAIKEEQSPLAVSCQKVTSLTEEFLAQAQKNGHACERLCANDLFLAALAMAWVANHVGALGSSCETGDERLAHGYLRSPCPTQD